MLHKTEAQVGDEVDAVEFAEWVILKDLQPWGMFREELQTAMICVAVSSAFGAKTCLGDWMLSRWLKPRQSRREQAASADLEEARAYLKALSGVKPHHVEHQSPGDQHGLGRSRG